MSRRRKNLSPPDPDMPDSPARVFNPPRPRLAALLATTLLLALWMAFLAAMAVGR